MRTALCEIGTTDCIHDHCSEKRAAIAARARAVTVGLENG
jgi:hypothetical protein